MKNLEIGKHMNLFDEAYLLLYQWVNKNDLGELRLRDAQLMHFDIEVYKKRFDLLTNIFKDVTNQLKGKKDRIEYYFKERSSEFSTLASFALLYEVHQYDNRLVTYEERTRQMVEAKKVKFYAEVINAQDAENVPEEDLKTFADLLKFIDSSVYEKDIKWETAKIYNSQEAAYKEVSDIIKEVIKLLTDKYSEEIAGLEQEFYDYWSEYQQKNDVIKTINDKLKISWESEKATVLIPNLFLPYSITFSITEPEYSEKDIIRVNVMLDAGFILTDKEFTKEEVVNIGKLLSDKSKMDILDFVSRKPYYGKEIANELNLSTATISYHVNALLQIGFIKADLFSNKVYYSIDKERIVAYLEDIKNYFNKL